jgi:surface polysaccharide O-acyltransferase-like enzyme
MKQQRMLYVDNLRLLVIILVVCMHTAVTYSGLGGWYYKEGLQLDKASLIFFGVFQTFLQAFFMGTLFMLAGYYAAASLKSKGTSEFIHGRLIRLGIPTLFYMLVIHPLTVYYLKDWDHTLIKVPFQKYYAGFITNVSVLGATGPMWFALALLIFCLAYALEWAILGASGLPPPASRPFCARIPVLLALAASMGAFALRLVWPIGQNIFNMQLCYFSQYVILFCFGITAHGNGWLNRIEYALGRRCLIAAFLGIPVLLAMFHFGGVFSGHAEEFWGGWHWQSFAFAIWESFTGVFMSVGLISVIRRHWNSQETLVKSLSASAFAVYVFHTPILVFISQMLRPVALAAFPKFLLVFVVALPVCFGVARVIRAVPLLREMVRS